MKTTLEVFEGRAAEQHIDDLAQLRITVFREYPYLYDGDIASEMKYLARFIDNPSSVLILAKNERGDIVGASTCALMGSEMPEVQEPFIEAGYDIKECFYFGESVLLPSYRKQGIGAEFFILREELARAQDGIQYLTFCAVERPENDPKKPMDYHSPISLWKKQGFERQPNLFTHFEWQELNENQKTKHKMNFWIKRI